MKLSEIDYVGLGRLDHETRSKNGLGMLPVHGETPKVRRGFRW